MKLVTLNQEQFDRYAKNHRYRSFYQTTAYGNSMLKFGYNVHYFGIVDKNNSLIGATMIMYKAVFMNNKIAYAPRGILFDYSDSQKVKELAECLKSLLGKQGFMLLRMDPYIPISIHSNDGNLINMNNQESVILENLATAKFEYKGKNLYFENEKPRWEALVLLNKSNDDLFDSFDKRTRNKIRKAANLGIEVYKDPEKNIKSLYPFIKAKENKPINYFQELVNNFNDMLNSFGGHPMAAGCSLEKEKLQEFRKKINENCTLEKKDFAKKVQIDIDMPVDYITMDLIHQLSVLEPFGKENKKPLFAHRKLKVERVNVFGKNKNVIKLALKSSQGTRIDGMIFEDEDEFREKMGTAKYITCTYYPVINEYQGYKSLQINIQNYFFVEE